MCPNCLVRDPLNLEVCVRCQRRQRVNTRGPEGPICAGCVPRVTATCSVCARTATCMVSKTTGRPWCRACARAWMQCSRCRQWDAVRAGTRDAPLCAGCAVPDPSFWTTCPGCGTGARLIAGVCRRCRLHRQLGEVLAGPALQALHNALATTDRPDTITNWLTQPTVRSVLVDLATGQRPLTHATLDDLPPSKAVEHLRSVLVATTVLPARDEQLRRLQRWITQTLTERTDPRDRELLRRYAVWHELRRIRQRNRGTETTYGQLDMVRQRLRGAIRLLDWLHTRGLTLSSCRQPDLDAWLTSNDASHRAEVGHFVRWAISQRINPDLRFAATRWTGPAQPLDQQQRWEQAKRLLHDHGLDTDDRVAGLLVLLYAQRPAAISRLTLDDINTSDDTVELRLGTAPVMLPRTPRHPRPRPGRHPTRPRRHRRSRNLTVAVPRRTTRPPRQRRPTRRTAPPARDPPRPGTLDRVVPARHRDPRRRPGPHARHPHQGRRPVATRLRRRLDQLRRPRQPPHGQLPATGIRTVLISNCAVTRRPGAQGGSDRPDRTARHQTRQIPTLRCTPCLPRRPLIMLSGSPPNPLWHGRISTRQARPQHNQRLDIQPFM